MCSTATSGASPSSRIRPSTRGRRSSLRTTTISSTRHPAPTTQKYNILYCNMQHITYTTCTILCCDMQRQLAAQRVQHVNEILSTRSTARARAHRMSCATLQHAEPICETRVQGRRRNMAFMLHGVVRCCNMLSQVATHFHSCAHRCNTGPLRCGGAVVRCGTGGAYDRTAGAPRPSALGADDDHRFE